MYVLEAVDSDQIRIWKFFFSIRLQYTCKGVSDDMVSGTSSYAQAATNVSANTCAM